MPIIKYRFIWYIVSGVLILGTLVLLFTNGLNFGIDFVGGTLHEINFTDQRPELNQLQEKIPESIEVSTVQPIGDHGILLRYQNVDNTQRQELLDSLTEQFGEITEARFESIGPTIGQELRQKALWAVALVLIAIILYLTYAFRKVSKPVQSWKYGLLTILAAGHDILILLGFFILLGMLRGSELNSLFVIAVLTTLGYSVHDSIVVFDRTRANLLDFGSDQFEKAVTLATTQTITRSLNTSLTTMIPLLALLLFGGYTLFDFVLALMVGLLIGTYSSIFIASPLLLDWQKFSSRRAQKKAIK